VNHFEGHIELSRKYDLFKNVKNFLENPTGKDKKNS